MGDKKDELRDRVAELEAELLALRSDRVSASDRLAFLRDYLMRNRQDSMQDKTVLTQLTYTKVIAFSVMVSFMRTPAATIGLALLPIVLYSLDYLHRSRFNEIFDRWIYSAEKLAGPIRQMLETETPLFEEVIVTRHKSGDFVRSEGFVRALMTGLSTAGTVPIVGAHAARILPGGSGATVSAIWCAVLALVYISLFSVRTRYKDTHMHPLAIPSVLVGMALLMAFAGDNIIWYYSRILGLGS